MSKKEKPKTESQKAAEVVNAFPTKYKEGFMQSEIDELLKQFPSVTLEQFNSAVGIVTGQIIDGNMLIYHTDIEMGLCCCLENRKPNSLEFD